MSLDVSLYADEPIKVEAGSGIFVRRHGATVEITRAEWDAKFPDSDPVVSVRESEDDSVRLYSANITHNLNTMAGAAGIYEALWRPEEIGITKAEQLIEPLTRGLAMLKADPVKFSAFNSPNGWGLYEHFVPFVKRYLQACREHPTATVRVSR